MNYMPAGQLLYEGKAKQIYETENEKELLMKYKDDATAFDGQKKGVIQDKGIVNNRVTNLLFRLLEIEGIETHLIKQIDDRNSLVKNLQIIPVEVVTRNVVAGSLAQRIGKEEGFPLPTPIIELYYKNDDLHDPMINEYHARAMGWATDEQLKAIQGQALKINKVLQKLFDSINIILVDFKLEFGIYEGRVILADEISPDTCRLWDRDSFEKLDKDRFRRNLGQEAEAYQEVAKRIETALSK